MDADTDEAKKDVAETKTEVGEVGEGKVTAGLSTEPRAGETPAVQTEEKKQAAKTDARTKEGDGDGEGDDESFFKDLMGLLLRAGCWALLIYLLIFQVSVVEGPSMQPTFEPGDRLVIDKLTYRFSSVQRFDVIVFGATDREKPSRMERDYIKRVMGLPGERVEIRDGFVWVKGPADTQFKRLDEPYDPTEADRLPGFDQGQGFTVPPGHYFVMGDNRRYSKDSRIKGGSRETLGFVPYGQIKGLVRLRIWPWGRRATFRRGQEQVTTEQ